MVNRPRLDSDEGTDGDEFYDVMDECYNRVRGVNFARPFGAVNVLLLRDLRSNFLVLDVDRGQVYRPRNGCRGRHDFSCDTVNVLSSLRPQRIYPGPEGSEICRNCPGYTYIREHSCEHDFCKEDVLKLLLCHRLKLRTVIARSVRLVSLFFKRLYHDHFPGSHQNQVDLARDLTLKDMAYALRSAANDGVLFTSGNINPNGANRDGSVVRSECSELQRVFSPNDVQGLDHWARCYEWTHWPNLMSAIGFKRPSQQELLDYWYVNDLVRPSHRPLPRNCLPQPWVGRVIAQHKRSCAPNPEDEADLIAYQTWDQHLDRYFYDQGLLWLEDHEDPEDPIDSSQADADAYISSLDAEIESYSPSPANGHPDTEEEEYALQVEHEFRQLRSIPTGSESPASGERAVFDIDRHSPLPEPSPAKRRRLSVDSNESLGSVPPITPSSSVGVGDVGFLDDSAYGGAYAPNYSDNTEANVPDTDQSGYETGSETNNSAAYYRNPELFDLTPLIPSPLDVNQEDESDNDVIYVETVSARRTSGPLIDLN